MHFPLIQQRYLNIYHYIVYYTIQIWNFNIQFSLSYFTYIRASTMKQITF